MELVPAQGPIHKQVGRSASKADEYFFKYYLVGVEYCVTRVRIKNLEEIRMWSARSSGGTGPHKQVGCSAR